MKFRDFLEHPGIILGSYMFTQQTTSMSCVFDILVVGCVNILFNTVSVTKNYKFLEVVITETYFDSIYKGKQ